MPDYTYTPGQGVSALNKNIPDGTIEPVSILDDAIRQIKAYLTDTGVGGKAPQKLIDDINTAASALTSRTSALEAQTAGSSASGLKTLITNHTSSGTAHNATAIVQDSNNRFITDAERTSWNGKATTGMASISLFYKGGVNLGSGRGYAFELDATAGTLTEAAGITYTDPYLTTTGTSAMIYKHSIPLATVGIANTDFLILRASSTGNRSFGVMAYEYVGTNLEIFIVLFGTGTIGVQGRVLTIDIKKVY